jgi:hypothetical protein
VEWILFVHVETPRGHAVVEAVEVLRTVVDRAERFQRRDFAIRRLAHFAFGVVKAEVDALVAFPLADQACERTPFLVVSHGRGR